MFGAQTDRDDQDLRRLVDNVYGLDGVDDVLTAEAEAHKQEVRELSVTPLTFLSCFLFPHAHACPCMPQIGVQVYAQPIGTLNLCILAAGTGHAELQRVAYNPAPDAAAKAKAVTTPNGAFVRRRWVVPKALLESDPRSADVPFRLISFHNCCLCEIAGVVSPFCNFRGTLTNSRPGDGDAVDAVLEHLAKAADEEVGATPPAVLIGPLVNSL